jgi:hypothetical protein
MDGIKAWFAQDWVKVVAGGLYFIGNGILMYLPEGGLKTTLLSIWNGLITPLAIYLGITSGGTSGLRSNESRAVTAQLETKGVVTK